jgi:hypothetical protein
MPDSSDSNALAFTIDQMCEGDIKSFMRVRALMDDVSFLDLWSNIREDQFFGFFVGKSFLEQVISNLAADSMFEFPPEGTPLVKLFRDLSMSAGKFLKEFIITEGADYSVGIRHLNNAIKLYYSYLKIVNEEGKSSDLGDQDHLWQSEENRTT